jgi:hypothetical protein
MISRGEIGAGGGYVFGNTRCRTEIGKRQVSYVATREDAFPLRSCVSVKRFIH